MDDARVLALCDRLATQPTKPVPPQTLRIARDELLASLLGSDARLIDVELAATAVLRLLGEPEQDSPHRRSQALLVFSSLHVVSPQLVPAVVAQCIGVNDKHYDDENDDDVDNNNWRDDDDDAVKSNERQQTFRMRWLLAAVSCNDRALLRQRIVATLASNDVVACLLVALHASSAVNAALAFALLERTFGAVGAVHRDASSSSTSSCIDAFGDAPGDGVATRARLLRAALQQLQRAATLDRPTEYLKRFGERKLIIRFDIYIYIYGLAAIIAHLTMY